MTIHACSVLIAMQALLLPAAAQAPQPPSLSPCSIPEMRQLDFWLGSWNVFDTAKGYQVGTSNIERVVDGCGIAEAYDAPKAPGGAYSGKSYSAFDRRDGKWHQFYVDTGAAAMWYSGELQGADLALVASVTGGKLTSMTYRPLEGGAVEQIGIISSDDGKTWVPSYDYTYRRKNAPTGTTQK
ncbi:MAG: hypothetical protein ABIO29_00680 [Sphingomicrobium sp.]